MGDVRQIRTVIANSTETWEVVPLVTRVAQVPDEITPEIVTVVQAAANEFFGKRVRILSIRLLSDSSRDPSRWAQRGRDTIQASHNAVQQRH